MNGKRGRPQASQKIMRTLRDCDAMLNSGTDVAAVLQFLVVGAFPERFSAFGMDVYTQDQSTFCR
jgi:hypothetical protein